MAKGYWKNSKYFIDWNLFFGKLIRNNLYFTKLDKIMTQSIRTLISYFFLNLPPDVYVKRMQVKINDLIVAIIILF